MVTACWTGSGVEGFVKALKFVELSAINMFAVTNLAICANLALIVSVSSGNLHIVAGFARSICKLLEDERTR